MIYNGFIKGVLAVTKGEVITAVIAGFNLRAISNMELRKP